VEAEGGRGVRGWGMRRVWGREGPDG
jgi:hypothetical protein